MFVLFPTVLFVRAPFSKTLCSRHGKPGPIHRSRSRRDPCTQERVVGAQFFFPAGVDKTISRGFSTRSYFFHTYVPRLTYRYIFVGVFCTEHGPQPKQKQQCTERAYLQYLVRWYVFVLRVLAVPKYNIAQYIWEYGGYFDHLCTVSTNHAHCWRKTITDGPSSGSWSKILLSLGVT